MSIQTSDAAPPRIRQIVDCATKTGRLTCSTLCYDRVQPGDRLNNAMRSLKFLWLALIPMLMGTELYQWTNADGVVTYSQQAPHGVEASRITVRDGAATATVQPEPVRDEPDKPKLTPAQQEHLERMEAIEAARQEEIARIRQSNCDRSRAILERLQSAARIRIRDERGEQRVMSESELQGRIADAQRGIAENCSELATAEG